MIIYNLKNKAHIKIFDFYAKRGSLYYHDSYFCDENGYFYFQCKKIDMCSEDPKIYEEDMQITTYEEVASLLSQDIQLASSVHANFEYYAEVNIEEKGTFNLANDIVNEFNSFISIIADRKNMKKNELNELISHFKKMTIQKEKLSIQNENYPLFQFHIKFCASLVEDLSVLVKDKLNNYPLHCLYALKAMEL